ncbi:MAG: PAS domain S-box protein [Bacteroidia bacterium]|nr:PAS domain S-box protein [Bacteroidia bacterium]
MATEVSLRTRLGALTIPAELAACMAPEGYYLANAQGVLLEVGPSMAERLGYDATGLVGQSFTQLFCPTYQDLATTILNTVLDGIPEPERAWSYKTRSGELRKLVADHLLVSTDSQPKLLLGLIRA